MEFSSVLLSLRQENGLSQRQAAADLNISQALLSHYEKGIREPRLDFVLRICDYYGVSADYLLGRTDSKDSASVFGHAEGPLGDSLRRLILASSALISACTEMQQSDLAQECVNSLGFSLQKLCSALGLSEDTKPAAVVAAKCDSLSKETEAHILEVLDTVENYVQIKDTAMKKLSEQSPALCRALRDFTDSTKAYFNPTR